ncbi:MAG: hypothetical protein Q8L14_30855 [Myxococcales bacterium]|nr:hypothetical protein [Myxococcales bacterium]
MRTETPGRWSSLGLLVASVVIGAVGFFLSPLADSVFDSRSDPNLELAWEVPGFLLALGVGGVGWSIRDLIVGPTKR